MFDDWMEYFQEYYKLNGFAFNDAINYGVIVSPNNNALKIIGVHHLAPEENKGNHNIFIDVLDIDGRRIYGTKVYWNWEGMQPEQTPLPLIIDKLPNEVSDISMGSNQKIKIWIGGESAERFHTNHPDEPGPNGEIWNSIGHHSFFVCFQEVDNDVVIPPEPPEPPIIKPIARVKVVANLEWLNTLIVDEKGNVTFTVKGN